MYEDYFGFTALPFQLTPDSRFFYESAQHQKAFAHLTFGLNHPEGFVVITGEVGAGKTIMIEHLLSELNKEDFIVGKIATTNLDPNNLLKMIAFSFGIDYISDDKAEILKTLEGFMKSAHSQDKTVLLIVDEAQNLPFKAIEELRMLSNMQIDHHAPLQFILTGQPQLRAMLASEELRQLRQRIIASYHLGPLSAEDVKGYIEHRLKMVGWEGNPTFEDAAFDVIAKYSEGIPRQVNTLTSRILLYAYLEEVNVITKEMALKVAKEKDAEMGDFGFKNNKKLKTASGKQALKETSQNKALAKKVGALEAAINHFEGFLKTHLKAESSSDAFKK
jgi:general secretion pathway protein A